MTMSEIIRQGLYYARTCQSLWLFGFVVGLASGSSSGAGGGDRGGGGWSVSIGPAAFSVEEIAPKLLVIAIAVLGLAIVRFISEGALIEGIARVRRGGTMTTRDGFRAGVAHWGVLLRIALLYLAAMMVSLALLAAPCVLALRAFGPLGAVAVAVPAVVIAVPWLVTLFLIQAFASRIAVLEDRHALDAIGKARLFLHGRLMHGLTLVVATFAGSLLISAAGLVVIAPVVLLLVALVPVLRLLPVIVLGCLVLLPVLYVLSAVLGTFRSSIWTLGYMTQVES